MNQYEKETGRHKAYNKAADVCQVTAHVCMYAHHINRCRYGIFVSFKAPIHDANDNKSKYR